MRCHGGPVIKGNDDTDVPRLKLWDFTLEAIDTVGHAEDQLALEDAYHRAHRLIELLARDEHWDVTSNALLDELAHAAGRRREQLGREELFVDTAKKVDPCAGSVSRRARVGGGDLVP